MTAKKLLNSSYVMYLLAVDCFMCLRNIEVEDLSIRIDILVHTFVLNILKS